MREERAAAHGIAPEELEDFYAARNLLNRRVTTVDVASSVAFFTFGEGVKNNWMRDHSLTVESRLHFRAEIKKQRLVGQNAQRK